MSRWSMIKVFLILPLSSNHKDVFQKVQCSQNAINQRKKVHSREVLKYKYWPFIYRKCPVYYTELIFFSEVLNMEYN